ncbi:hypothetical protein ASPVEDRAFT_238155 [Aspergillus versicolor CBS 583.65]|uniref:Uncharacterized protein n=1 Tax=Aspergillus versicolor CBS 583.65 TaxID=1036611 RepID=A0A1L9P4S2_ASPVE|nr:uncharacterized protein ASPVEDRAFT_238155 [Aspergillus versicolor CBS 583.65]OJI96444.1 hypothetical protein ASPVEDRAFT_238155 [Aspergillus versicolor CBS 583.65]
MLLPPINVEREKYTGCAVQGNTQNKQNTENTQNEVEPKLPLRESHSIPHSLPPSFSRTVSEPSTPAIDNLPRAAMKQRSKSVRFSISDGMTQYFNPTEMTRSVHKSTFDI